MLTTRAAPLLLLAATLAQQIWYVSRAVLPAQDAVDFVSVAQRIEREGLLATLRAEPVPPLFPASVCVTHAALVRLAVIEPREWGRAAQWAAAPALVAAVVPAFLFARRLVDPLSAFCGTLVFFSLPEAARLGADGTSDALHLFFAAAALWSLAFMLDVTESRPRRWSLVCGGCLGAALLVRSEMLVVAAVMLAVGIAAMAVSSLADFRRRGLVAACGLGIVVAGAPYLASGIANPFDLARRLRGGGAPTGETPLNAVGTEQPTVTAAQKSVEPRLGKKDPTRSIRFHGFFATVAEFAKELAQASAYLFVPLAYLGAAALRKQRGNRQLAGRLIWAIAATLGIAIFAVAWQGGYLSSRHVLLPLLMIVPYAGFGIVRLAEVMAGRSPTVHSSASIAAASIFVMLCLAAAREPAHAAQSAHREAARWLNAYGVLAGRVLDQQGFTALSTGRVTYRFEAAEQALDDGQLAYVVLERADIEADSARGARLRQLFGSKERPGLQFTDPRGRTERDVFVLFRPGNHRPTLRDPIWQTSPLTTAQQSRPSHAR